MEPLKYQNKKLTKENNELHYSLIKIKEDAEFKDVKWKTVYKSLEDEKRDLKFMLTQKDAKIEKILSNSRGVEAKLSQMSQVGRKFGQEN